MKKTVFIQGGMYIVAVLGILTMLMSFGFIQANSQSAALQSRYDQKKNEINGQISGISEQISKLSGDLHQISEKKNSLIEQVAQMRQEIAKTEELITETKVAISKIELQIIENEKRILALNNDLKELVRDMQRQEKINIIESILSSRNITEALTNIYNMTSLQTKADEINDQLKAIRKELDENKKQQEDTQKTLENTQFLLNSKKDSLDGLLRETQGEEQKYQELLKASNEQKKVAQAEAFQINEEFKTAIAQENAELDRQRQQGGGGSGNTSNGAYGYETNGASCRFSERGKLTAPKGYFVWPSRGYITQNYGCPSSAGINHDAFDIANSSGTPIVSVAAGTVMQKGYHSGGFGNFIIVKHVLPSGQRVYSLYAHLNSPAIGSGVVAKGQTIGYMGTTGMSTGVHLHFMLISDSIEATGNVGCNYGNSKCFDPATFLP
jgi:murein DD-endopeptidase MepM/ murein hydrolase activator NlpD